MATETNNGTLTPLKQEVVDTAQYADAEGRDICKDFLRNVCSRGSKCKYFHPTELANSRPKKDFQFCHDYQNRGCFRDNCRFIHSSREDEDAYKRTGKVSEFLARAILAAGQGSTDDIAGIPICKDYLIGRCDRGRNRCRYWHIEANEAVTQGSAADHFEVPMRPDMPPAVRGDWMPPPPPMHGLLPEPPNIGYKRARMDEEYGTPAVGYAGGNSTLQEENLVLRQKLDVLKKQVADLTAANEVLLEQNARLRAKLQVGPSLGGGAAAGAAEAQIAASIAAAAASISNVLQTSAAPTSALAPRPPLYGVAGEPPNMPPHMQSMQSMAAHPNYGAGPPR